MYRFSSFFLLLFSTITFNTVSFVFRMAFCCCCCCIIYYIFLNCFYLYIEIEDATTTTTRILKIDALLLYLLLFLFVSFFRRGRGKAHDIRLSACVRVQKLNQRTCIIVVAVVGLMMTMRHISMTTRRII